MRRLLSGIPYLIATVVTLLAGLVAFGAFRGDIRMRTLIVLALTLVAIVWYTAFTFRATAQAHRTTELTKQLAEIEAARLRHARIEVLTRLRDDLRQVKKAMGSFTSRNPIEAWKRGEDLGADVADVVTDPRLIDQARMHTAILDDRTRRYVESALRQIQNADAARRMFLEGRTPERAQGLVEDVQRAEEELAIAEGEVFDAILGGGSVQH